MKLWPRRRTPEPDGPAPATRKRAILPKLKHIAGNASALLGRTGRGAKDKASTVARLTGDAAGKVISGAGRSARAAGKAASAAGETIGDAALTPVRTARNTARALAELIRTLRRIGTVAFAALGSVVGALALLDLALVLRAGTRPGTVEIMVIILALAFAACCFAVARFIHQIRGNIIKSD